MSSGSESIFWNPAALPTDQTYEIAAVYGSANAVGPQRSGLAISSQAPGWGAFGLGFSDGRYQASGFHDYQVIGAAALEITRGFWIGTSQKYIGADPGGLKGWSMDLGSQAAFGQAFRVGVNFSDAASSLVWGNGVEESQPASLQAGAAFSPLKGIWLSAQNDWIDRGGAGSTSQWRAGAEGEWFGGLLALRGGATSAGPAEVFFSGGIGTRWITAAGIATGLDYAYLAGSAGTTGRHLASLSLAMGVRSPAEEVKASIKQVHKDKSGKLYRATLELDDTGAGGDVADWELKVQDRKGRVRTIRGSGPIPSKIPISSPSDDGGLLDADGLSYTLKTTTRSGRQTSKRASLIAAGPAAASLGGLQDFSGGSSFELRGDVDVKSIPKTRPRVGLKGGQMKLEGGEIEVPDAFGEGSNSWEIRIRDDEGQVVKTLKGTGRPPKSIQLPGKNDLGEPLDLGLGSSFEVRVQDASGNEKAVSDDLVKPDQFRKLAPEAATAKARPKPREEKVFTRSGSGWKATFFFEVEKTSLSRRAKRGLKEAMVLLERFPNGRMELSGWAANGEADPLMLSQARAESVLRALVEEEEVSPGTVIAKGRGVDADSPAANACRVDILIFE